MEKVATNDSLNYESFGTFPTADASATEEKEGQGEIVKSEPSMLEEKSVLTQHGEKFPPQ